MARPRLSERAQQKALRQQLREHGRDDAAIAAEFARQYRMRPRKAWRHAYGWTLREAAGRINELAAQDGLDPQSRAGMTAAHLCEYEDWPGEASPGSGREPTGRKPTAYILSLLARAYSTTVPSLVDETDQAWLPPADRLVITQLAATVAAAQPARVADAAEVAETARPDNEQIVAAAREAVQHAELAIQRQLGDTGLADVRAQVRQLSQAYMTGEPFPLFQRMRRVRAGIHRALDLRMWPRDETELYFLLGLMNSLMAVAASDLGYAVAAEKLAQAGWAYATIVKHPPLMAQVQAELATISYWSGRPDESRRHAVCGLELLSRGPNAAQLCLHQARAAARLGDVAMARQAIAAAADARDRDHQDDVLEIAGEFGFSLASQHYLAGAALAEAPGAERDAEAELELATSMYDLGPGPDGDHSFGCAARARTALAATRLRAGELDAVRPAIAPVLALPRAQRIDSIAASLSQLRAELARPRYRGAPGAADLNEQIRLFLRETAVAGVNGG
jgi:hypothetical protein